MANPAEKVLVTGASGLLGRALVSQFKQASWEVLGLAFSRAKDGLVKVDLNDEAEVVEIIHKFKPAVIVHAAAQRFPDKVEENYEGSYKLNVDCSKMLARCAAEEKCGFVLISTDYVFDGSNPPYKESDTPNPLNKYGQTKADAEEAVLAAYPESCVLRIPVLYGDEEYLGESAISLLLKMLLDSDKDKPQSVSNYEIRFPAHADDIASICLQLAEKIIQEPGVHGIYQWCGSEPFTKYGMTKVIASVFGLSATHVTSDNNPNSAVPRPQNTQLCRGRLESLGIGQHTPFRVGIRRSYTGFIPSELRQPEEG